MRSYQGVDKRFSSIDWETFADFEDVPEVIKVGLDNFVDMVIKFKLFIDEDTQISYNFWGSDSYIIDT